MTLKEKRNRGKDMKKSLRKQDLALGMIASMAEESPIIFLGNPDKKMCVLPASYKQNIQNIMCANNGWLEEFSVLIDTEEYLADHFGWELEFSMALEQTIKKLGKSFEYDFKGDMIKIEFTSKEVEDILSKFSNKTRNTLNHFSRLVRDRIYTRQYQEEYHDYSAIAVERMKMWNEARLNDPNFSPLNRG